MAKFGFARIKHVYFFESRTTRRALQSPKATCLLRVETALELVLLENHAPFVVVQELHVRFEAVCTCFCGLTDNTIFAQYLVFALKMHVCYPKT